METPINLVKLSILKVSDSSVFKTCQVYLCKCDFILKFVASKCINNFIIHEISVSYFCQF